VSVAGATEKAEKTALPPREPTFLARYPRNLKLAALIIIVVGVGLLLGFLGSGPSPSEQKTVTTREAVIHSADRVATDQVTSRKTTGSTATASQAALNDQDDHNVKMAPAPDPGLTEDTSQGSLPRVGADGRQPWQVYARPFNTADQRPRLAIVIVDLGLARVASDAVIARLPATVTLAFDSQSPVAGAWGARARQDGHETLLMVPMEPFDYPRSDPGTGALLTTLPNTDNIERLLAAMRQGMGYVGITTMTGSRFTDVPDKMRPVLAVLKDRGLMVFDTRVAPHSVVVDMAHDMHVPATVQTERIDQDLSPEAIDKALDQLEKDTRLNGRAVGVTSPEPIVIEKLQAWLKDLPGRGIALAPVSAMVQ
jgi:polysaccharide deacetylase 2 family uncharacterized protein YibQ